MKQYPIGLYEENSLVVSGNTCFHYEQYGDDRIRLIECDVEKKSMTVKTRKAKLNIWNSMDENDFENTVSINIDDENNRWEGDSCFGKPCGYGCMYNTENQLIYRGFLLDVMKVCYGVTFYGDIGTIQYMGNFYKGCKHGYGKLYDRDQNLVFEGNWVNNHPLLSTNITLSGKLNENEIHYGLEYLYLDDSCEWKLPYFMISHFDHLKKLHVNRQSLQNVSEFHIHDCDCLTEVIIGKVEERNEEEGIREMVEGDEEGIREMVEGNEGIREMVDDDEEIREMVDDEEGIEEMVEGNDEEGIREMVEDNESNIISICNCNNLQLLWIGDYCFNSIESLQLHNLPSLTFLTIGDYSFQTLTQYEIEDLPLLKELTVGEHSYLDADTFRLSNLPRLISFTTGWGSFISVSDIILIDLPLLKQLNVGETSFLVVGQITLMNVCEECSVTGSIHILDEEIIDADDNSQHLKEVLLSSGNRIAFYIVCCHNQHL